MFRASSRCLPVLLLLLLAGCSTTAISYIDQQPGYSVTRGRIERVENVSSEDLVPLADGVAVRLDQPATVTIRFDDDNTRVMDLGAGAIVICSHAADYVLVSQSGSSTEDTGRR